MERIVVVGLGGTGSYLVQPLARYLNSSKWKGALVLVDGDKYEMSNVDRQEFPSVMVNVNKAEAHTRVIRTRFPDLNVICVDRYLGYDNSDDIISEGCVVFGCVDNHFARRLICEIGGGLRNFTFISSGNEMTDGNVYLYARKDGADVTPPPYNVHPEITMEGSKDRSGMSCEELSELPGGGQVIFTNMTAACVSLMMFWSYCSGRAEWSGVREIYFNIDKAKTRGVQNG